MILAGYDHNIDEVSILLLYSNFNLEFKPNCESSVSLIFICVAFTLSIHELVMPYACKHVYIQSHYLRVHVSTTTMIGGAKLACLS
jgi:hypothetical protein